MNTKSRPARTAFYLELARIRKCGFAFDNEEQIVGIRCNAAPVRDYSEKAGPRSASRVRKITCFRASFCKSAKRWLS